jgi:HK97 family phage prohead protease
MENKNIIKSSQVEIKASDEEKRIIEAIGSKEVVDRDKEIVRVDGIDLKNYKKNPVVLFGHNARDLPVARAEKVWIDKDTKSLMFKLQFPEPEVSSFADTVYKLMKAGYLNTMSIGFVPDWKAVEYDEKAGTRIFNKVELLEVSIVPVPANPSAVVTSKMFQKAVDDEVIDELELKDFELNLNKYIDIQPEEVKEETKIEQEIITTDTSTDGVEETKQVEEEEISLDSILKAVDNLLQKEEQTIAENQTYLDYILSDLFEKKTDVMSDKEVQSQEIKEDLVEKYLKDIGVF